MPLIKGFSVVGVNVGRQVGHRTGRSDPGVGEKDIATIDCWAAEGKIKPHICATYPLEKALDAMRLMQQRGAIGKVLISTNQSS